VHPAGAAGLALASAAAMAGGYRAQWVHGGF
jgi:hypothetical protein